MALAGLSNPVTLPPLYDETEVLKHWLPRAESMARTLNLRDPEGAAAEALTIILEKRYLDRWDPSGGRSLNTFCYNMIQLKLRGWGRTERRIASAECESTSATDEDGRLSIEPTAPEMGYDVTEDVDLFKRLLSAVKNVPTPTEKLDPRDLLQTIVSMALSNQAISDGLLARRLHVSVKTVRVTREALQEVLWRLREAAELRHKLPALDVVLDPPEDELPFRTMKREALRALVAEEMGARGIPVSRSYYLPKDKLISFLVACARGEELVTLNRLAYTEYRAHQDQMNAKRRKGAVEAAA